MFNIRRVLENPLIISTPLLLLLFIAVLFSPEPDISDYDSIYLSGAQTLSAVKLFEDISIVTSDGYIWTKDTNESPLQYFKYYKERFNRLKTFSTVNDGSIVITLPDRVARHIHRSMLTLTYNDLPFVIGDGSNMEFDTNNQVFIQHRDVDLPTSSGSNTEYYDVYQIVDEKTYGVVGYYYKILEDKTNE